MRDQNPDCCPTEITPDVAVALSRDACFGLFEEA